MIQTPFRPKEYIRELDIELSPSGLLYVHAGYPWDGRSGPTYDSVNTLVPSLAHDALQQLFRMGKLPQNQRKISDDFFKALLLDRDMCEARAWAWHKGVRVGGAASAKRQPEDRRKVLYAP